MFGYEAANKTSNFTCCTGIQFITKRDKLIAIFIIDPDNQLAVFGSAFLFTAH
jgi:hypothetical protein